MRAETQRQPRDVAHRCRAGADRAPRMLAATPRFPPIRGTSTHQAGRNAQTAISQSRASLRI
jgi:hypothetical protein